MDQDSAGMFAWISLLALEAGLITGEEYIARSARLSGMLAEKTGQEDEGERPVSGGSHNTLHFIPRGPIAHLKHWVFHKGDADPWPSIPHGHSVGKIKTKLNPFTGQIFDEHGKVAGRISMKDNIALWNDEKFREFARGSIKHAMENLPNHSWPVSNPLILPRKRH